LIQFYINTKLMDKHIDSDLANVNSLNSVIY